MKPNRLNIQSRSLGVMICAGCLAAFTLLAAAPKPDPFKDTDADLNALPVVAEGFEIRLWAKEPLVRNPCSMAFDGRGRMFVGMGPQYRNPTPATPPDSVFILTDTDGDGVAERATVFATGFNAIQGLAWRGRDLWVANAPDLTIARDLDGDDLADEYVRVFTDLGNLEHGLHGLNWAPDGRLYMSKGNSKGLTQPGRLAPKPFRDLAGVTAPPDAPDFPPPKTFRRGEYRALYQDPIDDWGREGGVLRCDDGGANLEIVARGLRNPWDIAFSDEFDWIGTDNDQNEGDRVFASFAGAHFGWSHPWSASWTGMNHPPTAPVSGPTFEGSGTGVVWADAPGWPASHRRVFLINDWLRKLTLVYRPRWDGALMQPAGDYEPLVRGGSSLFRPTDMQFGPDSALYILGWGRPYGLELKDGEPANEGRVYRITAKGQPQPSRGEWWAAHRERPHAEWNVSQLLADLGHGLPAWSTDAADELVRRGPALVPELQQALGTTNHPPARQT